MKESIKGSDIVAIGTILSGEIIHVHDSIEINRHPEDVFSHRKFPFAHTVARYRVVLEQKFKGVFYSDTIYVYTGLGGGDCGIKFTTGTRYIFYGSKLSYFPSIHAGKNFLYPSGEGIFWTSNCTRTNLFDEIEKEEIMAKLD